MKLNAYKSSTVDLATHDLVWQASTWIDLIKISYKRCVAVRKVMAHAGNGKYFANRTRCRVGVERHKALVTATSETALQDGMVFSSERRINLPGQHRCSISLDNMAIFHDDCPEFLSLLSPSVHVVTA